MTRATVNIIDSGFEPVRKAVSPGAAVVWKNVGTADYEIRSVRFHDVAVDWQFRTQTFPSGDSTDYVINEEGVYECYCGARSEDVCDVVLVGDVALSDSLPCE